MNVLRLNFIFSFADKSHHLLRHQTLESNWIFFGGIFIDSCHHSAVSNYVWVLFFIDRKQP